MSDYRRWISYIYSYEHGEKRNNAGYARIELRDGRVKMTIYMTPGKKGGTVKVCYYKSQPGHFAGVLLGSLDLSVPAPVFRNETYASNMMESGLFFMEMNGLLLFQEDGQYYASSWEEDSLEEEVARSIIRLVNGGGTEESEKKSEAGATREEENIEEELALPERSAQEAEMDTGALKQEFEPIRENTERMEAEPVRKTADQREEEGIRKTEEQTEEELAADTAGPRKTGMADAENGEKVSVKDLEDSNKLKQDDSYADRNEVHGLMSYTASVNENRAAAPENGRGMTGSSKAGNSPESGRESGLRSRTEMEADTEAEVIAELKPMPEVKTENSLGNVSEAPGKADWKQQIETRRLKASEASNRNCCRGVSQAERIFCCLPDMYPFEEVKYEKGVRMEPQDIGMLPRNLWKLAGNSFLLHAYYTYHHLLFVRKRQKEGMLYYLMIPGVYSEKEQHMAQMFGFWNFCPVKRKTLEQGDFGYWYLEVKF